MQKTAKILLTVLLCLTLAAAVFYCVRRGQKPSALPTESGETAAADAVSAAESLSKRTKDAESQTASVRLADGATAVNGGGVGVCGDTVTVSAPGVYRFSGMLSDGQILVDTKGEVVLILDGVTVGNASDAAICIANADRTLIRLADGSENFLTSGSEREITAAAETDALADVTGAAVYARDDLSIDGTGSLTVYGYLNNGISTTDHLVVLGGSINCTAVNNGLRGKDSVTVAGGNVTVVCGNDGIKSDNDTETASGNVSVTGGTVTVTSFGDGIQAISRLTVSGGDLTVTAGKISEAETDPAKAGSAQQPDDLPADVPGGFAFGTPDFGNAQQAPSFGDRPDMPGGGTDRGGRPNGMGGDPSAQPTPDGKNDRGGGTVPDMPDGTNRGGGAFGGNAFSNPFEDSAVTKANGAKGLNCGGEILLSGGTLHILATSDAVHANGSVTVFGGDLYLETEDDGIHADDMLTVSGGTIVIARSYEGLEGRCVSIVGGDISITASDDGVNAADGSSASFFGGFGSDSADRPSISIAGGNLYVNADGDGLDSNGSITVSGGTVTVDGPALSLNGALDSESGILCTGGTVLAIGASGMAESFSQNSVQCSFALTVNGAAGTEITVTDENGKVLARHTSAKSFSSVVFTSPDLTQGGKYTVSVGTDVYTVDQTGVSVGGQNGMGGMGGNRNGFPR